MTIPAVPSTLRILCINPNSSKSITTALAAALIPHTPPSVELTFFTPSTGPPGIHSPETAIESCDACWAELASANPTIDTDGFDGAIVCCFSEHPLIAKLRDLYIKRAESKGKSSASKVIGMFHGGISGALLLSPEPFGILATGTGIKQNLIDAVGNYVGGSSSTRFAGVITTGLGVVELQEGDQAKVEKNMKATTRELVRNGARTIVLGCAGMSGMEDWVKTAARDEGVELNGVVDGARMGVGMLSGLIRAMQ